MKYMTSNEIRDTWVRFFKERGHMVEESASLIPNNDPTLLWINAGVAPLKKYFDGRVIPKNPRIVNAQKCIRTNDIENVGKTARHHTFFEMLGNFSIGDYFRDEVIPWAYELLTSDEYYGFDPDKLYITVYPSDQETYDAWLKVGVKEEHLILSKHNFWEIGEGPCGPDTEIFYDRGEKYGEADISMIEHDIENERYIEIWNIVFSQYNAKTNKKREEYKELPNKNIDTGMGLERMASVIQNTETNFETDLFVPVIEKIEEFTEVKYEGQMSFKVIADHMRTVIFAVGDGALLSNEGRGYVLRRLLRRAVKHGKMLGIEKPFLTELVDPVVAKMGGFYTHIKDHKDNIKRVISLEEKKFLETLSQGEKILEDMIKDNDEKILSGKDAFTLYDTYGFPLELTEELAEEHNIIVDKDGFKEEMQAQKDRARNARKANLSMNAQNEAYLSFKQPSYFTGYHSLQEKTTVLKAFPEGVVLEKTPFYAESGGQVADRGVIISGDQEYDVLDVQKLPNGQFLHMFESHNLTDGDEVEAVVDEHTRKLTMYNHSATHLMFAALRDIVGDHVSQQGSSVSSEALRFDFNHFESLDDQTLLKIEDYVNEKINENKIVDISEKDIDEAKKMGAIAEFGEKYDAKVRVIDMGYTVDLCGGTHVENTGDIERFAIASIENKGSGIYRIVGHANDSVENIRKQFVGYQKEMQKLLDKADKIIHEAKEHDIHLQFTFEPNNEIKGSYQDVIDKREEYDALSERVRMFEKHYEELRRDQMYKNIDQIVGEAKNNILVKRMENIDKKLLKPFVDRLSDRLPNGFILLANVSEDKVTFIAKSNNDIHAGNIAKKAAQITGGNGGGRADFAQAGGQDISKVDEALASIKEELL
ncbi:MAG: alanine--tRNA ligase [Candidatus Izemoplasmataceae bacterium]